MTDPSIASNLEAPRLPAPDGPSEPAPFRSATRHLYLTSDLRAETGLPRTHMDFYLREGIIQPTARTESGYLLFDERELETLRTVLRWREHGIGIREIRQRLGRDDR
ncbi:MAG TPA: MerR family transcriptional regulator [Thermomicrobiales bacterium]|nr:MerR family transcriptional regulator [Thermomicrobiales bacterium]